MAQLNPDPPQASIEVRAHAAPWRGAVELLVRSAFGPYERMDRKVAVLKWVKAAPVGEANEPTVRIPPDAAQVLMDDLWAAGLRPTEGTGSAGALRAVERHLEDMRRLVFEKEGT